MKDPLSKRAWVTLVAFAGFGVLACAVAFVWDLRRADPGGDHAWTVARIEPEDRNKPGAGPDHVFFKNGSQVDHIGFDLAYLGQLTSNDGSPVDVFSGRTCVNCDAGLRFFIYSPKSNQVGSYAYPAGEVRSSDDEDPNGNAPVYYSGRAFLGRCLGGEKANWKGIVAFGRYRAPSGEWQPVVQVYGFDSDGAFSGTAVYQNLPIIDETLRLVGQGTCSELPQYDYED